MEEAARAAVARGSVPRARPPPTRASATGARRSCARAGIATARSASSAGVRVDVFRQDDVAARLLQAGARGLVDYVSDMLSGTSLRACAELCGVSLKTSWFMRMRPCEVMARALHPSARAGPSRGRWTVPTCLSRSRATARARRSRCPAGPTAGTAATAPQRGHPGAGLNASAASSQVPHPRASRQALASTAADRSEKSYRGGGRRRQIFVGGSNPVTGLRGGTRRRETITRLVYW